MSLKSSLSDCRQRIIQIRDYFGDVDDDSFYNLKFGDVEWPPVNQTKNFYYLMRELAFNGESTLNNLTKMFDDYDNKVKSSYHIIYKMIYNDRPNLPPGLVKLHLVEKVPETKKLRLTKLGVLFFIFVFSKGLLKSKSNDLVSMKETLSTADYSNQANMTGRLDTIIERYPDYFPKLFGNIEFLKAHPRFDIEDIFRIIRGDFTSDIDRKVELYVGFYESHFSPAIDDELNDTLPLIVYLSWVLKNIKTVESAPNESFEAKANYTDYENSDISLNPEIDRFLKKHLESIKSYLKDELDSFSNILRTVESSSS